MNSKFLVGPTLTLALLLSGCSSNSADANGQGGAGPAGADGKDGENGADGKDGKTGKTGADGKDGSDGTNGANGTDGTNGTDGDPGADGSDGASAEILQTVLGLGDPHCWLGGIQVDSGIDLDGDGLEPTEVTQTEYLCKADVLGESGARLPYQVLSNSIQNGAYPGSTIEIRSGGFGSDAARHPSEPMQFYALTDRGPNADYVGSKGAGKIWAVPNYSPRIGLFQLLEDGSVVRKKTIILKDNVGNPTTGLPNPVYGATGEIPYNGSGDVIRVDMSQPYDAVTNPYKLDPYGIDSEGLVALADGTFWVSDEYGPHIVHYSATGLEIGRINPFPADTRNTELATLPAELAKRRANRGMECLAVTPDGNTLVGMMQSTLLNPSSATQNGDMTRIVTVNLETGAVGQYLYRQELKQNNNNAIVALSATKFAVIERDQAFYLQSGSAMKRVYEIDLSGATNVEGITTGGVFAQDAATGLTISGQTLEQVTLSGDTGWATLATNGIVPVTKKLLVDMVTAVGYPHDKMEGLWLIDESHLGVLNDDDFALGVSSNVPEQKYLDSEKTIVDGNTLYVIDGLDLSGN